MVMLIEEGLLTALIWRRQDHPNEAETRPLSLFEVGLLSWGCLTKREVLFLPWRLSCHCRWAKWGLPLTCFLLLRPLEHISDGCFCPRKLISWAGGLIRKSKRAVFLIQTRGI
ncbi:unnamed protein product [Blepharisma stoltei]|uniref:Uncharacterized protein n=1 Tax=Blepharisma stoltei TaxID=1481888 RepID=A0AAU9IYH4_9CILI|nr:unnamed protein product [Blepharisma stoltei]